MKIDDVQEGPLASPDEWADARTNRHGWGISSTDPTACAVAMQLAHDLLPADHPLKITREMPMRLRNFASFLRGMAETMIGESASGMRVIARSHAAELDEYAAKLAALLPPDD